jgi:hypothetical protein
MCTEVLNELTLFKCIRILDSTTFQLPDVFSSTYQGLFFITVSIDTKKHPRAIKDPVSPVPLISIFKKRA